MRSFTDADEDGEDIEASPSLNVAKRKEERRYRAALDETPTHTGGLTREAREKLEERSKKDRERGVYASTSKNKNSHSDEPNSPKSRDRHRRGDHGRDRDRRRNRDDDRDRHRGRNRNDERDKDDHKRRTWYYTEFVNLFEVLIILNSYSGKYDESDRRSRYTDRESSRYRSWSTTPSIRFSDAPLTPSMSIRDTPSR